MEALALEYEIEDVAVLHAKKFYECMNSHPYSKVTFI